MKNLKTRKEKIAYIVQMAIFAALSIILYYIRIPLPIFPSFLKVQFSALPIVICGFALGPISGVVVAIVKTLICLPISESMYIGDIADLIISSTYVLITSLVYMKNKTKKGAIKSLIFGTVGWIGVSCITNYFILVPFYIFVNKLPVATFVEMCSVISIINENNYKIVYVLLGALPFNIMLSTTVSLITFFVYKRISNLLKLTKDEK